jgi:hypothetical protein
MAQLAVVLPALFAQMERTSAIEWAAHLRESGHAIAEIVRRPGSPAPASTAISRHAPRRR